MPRTPSPLSDLPEAITGFLHEAFPEGHTLTRCVPLEGDASDRDYFRLTSKSPDTGERCTYVLMRLAEPWVPERAGEELPFVNIARHLAEKGVPVPGIYLDASDKGMILLEDVGAVTLETHLRDCSRDDRRRCYQQALEILVRMQARATQPSGRTCVALTYAFDANTFFRELCFFREHALEGLWGRKIPKTVRKEMESYFQRLCEQICSYPQRFTHRDYHARNLMVRGGRITVLDFQDARIGPVTYDLVSLLRDSYVCLEPEEQQDLLTQYLELCASEGIPVPGLEEFQEAFRRTGIQRNLKAIGTFAFQVSVKGSDRYRSSIPNTLNSLRLALEEAPDLIPLLRILREYMDGL